MLRQRSYTSGTAPGLPHILTCIYGQILICFGHPGITQWLMISLFNYELKSYVFMNSSTPLITSCHIYLIHDLMKSLRMDCYMECSSYSFAKQLLYCFSLSFIKILSRILQVSLSDSSRALSILENELSSPLFMNLQALSNILIWYSS